MEKKIDCRVFEDQLDALSQGTLPEEGMEQLQRHAEICPDCAMQVKVKEHLALPSLEGLEAEVPEEYLDSMWSRVQAGVSAARFGGSPGTRSPGRFPWLVPGMAAAIVALLFSTGFLFTELQQLKGGGQMLAREVFAQGERIAALGQGGDPSTRTASLTGRSRLDQSLRSQDSFSIREITEILAREPSTRKLCTASELSAFLSNAPGAPTEWTEVLAGFQEEDPIHVRELLYMLESSAVDPDLSFSAQRLMELFGAVSRSVTS